jgi:hypothetical protein
MNSWNIAKRLKILENRIERIEKLNNIENRNDEDIYKIEIYVWGVELTSYNKTKSLCFPELKNKIDEFTFDTTIEITDDPKAIIFEYISFLLQYFSKKGYNIDYKNTDDNSIIMVSNNNRN